MTMTSSPVGECSINIDSIRYNNQLRRRLAQVYEGSSYRWISRNTDHSHESVRRWMSHGVAPPSFLAATCTLMDVSPSWLLLGVDNGTRRYSNEISITPEDLKKFLDALSKRK